MMPTCREVVRLLASEQLAEEALSRRILVRLHLMMCDHCGRYARELESLGDVARDAFREPLDAGRLSELETAIMKRAAAGGAAAE